MELGQCSSSNVHNLLARWVEHSSARGRFPLIYNWQLKGSDLERASKLSVPTIRGGNRRHPTFNMGCQGLLSHGSNLGASLLRSETSYSFGSLVPLATGFAWRPVDS